MKWVVKWAWYSLLPSSYRGKPPTVLAGLDEQGAKDIYNSLTSTYRATSIDSTHAVCIFENRVYVYWIEKREIWI